MSFKELASHLLDLGKRNRLLNYKEKGYKTISILSDNLNTIYHNIVDSKEYKLILVEPIFNRQRTLTIDSEDTPISYSKYKAYDIISPILKKNELLAYKEGYPQERVLRSLYKEYKFSIAEKGINTLYIAFGMLKYEEGKNTYKAPILLIPLEYKRLNSGYSIKEREDEIILNPTLSYYLNEFYNIKLPTILDEDEDLEPYFNRLKPLLLKTMEITMECAIGIFSFNKMNMYDDLVNNESIVMSNLNIKSLVYKQNLGLNNNLSYKLYPVKDYDSSQKKAIELAAKGVSFTLEGPPGSGKSQTITNIIATLIGNGRKVLFVSEKLAALNVVYNNLKNVGLDDFALEIHSSKANKKDVINNIYRAASAPRYVTKNKSDILMGYNSYKDYLDSYNEIMHRPILNEKSIYDLICDYLKINEDPLDYKFININEIDNNINQIMDALVEYSNAIKPLGYNYSTLIFNIFNSLSYEYINYEIDNDLLKALGYLNKLVSLATNLNSHIKIKDSKINSINSLYKAIDFIDKINRLNIKSNAYFDSDKRASIINNIALLKKNKNSLPNISKFDKEILELDLNPIYRYLRGTKGFFSRLFDRKYKEYKREILGYTKYKLKHDEILSSLELIMDYQSKMLQIRKSLATIKSILLNTDINLINEDLKNTEGFIGYYVDFKDTNILVDTLIAFKNYYSEDLALNKLSRNIDSNKLDIYNASIELVFNNIKELYLKKSDIKAYSLVLGSLNKLEALNGKEFLDKYLSRGLPLDGIKNVFKKTYLRNKLLNEFKKYPILEGFNSESFDSRVNDFIDLDLKLLTLNRDMIIEANSKYRPDDVIKGGAFSILAREEAKLKRKMPIRMLLDEIGDFILDIKPVFLMSPLSVSTYLNSKANIFDTVIFDEASQIFAWDSLGSIYRAKQCIIIGDSKQMPPSSFFSAAKSMDDDEYDMDSYDLESILDMASESFIKASLSFHYRSRSEELIEFSNNNFYDHNLITIPEADSNKEGLGIDFIYLENGRYDMKTRTNLAEANKIADMVIEHLKNSNLSLGVVAFSEVQANLIEDVIEDRIRNDKSLLPLFDEDKEEPFFVKNLETVQGDERDRIIFSICYGYNEEGKFYQRFGPLNNIGGERRLNVAITRAKYNVTIVSSIKYSDIKPSEALGCKMLYEYLKFAENSHSRRKSMDTDNGLILSIKELLLANGYEVETSFGASKFKIDLAVRKRNSNKFIAAIMCSFDKFKDNNTSDRNRLIKNLLERQGWAYYRVYAPGYMLYNDIESKRLLDFLANLENGSKDLNIKDNSNNIDSSYLEVDSDMVAIEDEFSKYVFMDNKEALNTLSLSGANIMLKRLIEVEGPITKSFLYKRVSQILGKKSVTNLCRQLVDKNIPSYLPFKNDSYFISYMAIVPLRIDGNRAISDIPYEELMDGILKITKEASIIARGDCYKTLVNLLGIKRLMQNDRDRLDSAVVFLALDGKIAIKGDKLCV